MRKSIKKSHILIIGICVLLISNALFLLFFLHQDSANFSLGNSSQKGQSPPVLHTYQKNEDKNAYIQSLMAACTVSGGTDACYQKVADNLQAAFSLPDSLDILATNESSPPVYARCHQVTHYLGRSEYKTSQNLPTTLMSCNSTCEGGCYHGVVEEYLKEHDHNLSGESIKKTFTSICHKDSLSPLVFAECEHGLGHAAMYITNNDLIPSLTLCDTLSGVSNREHCYSGVFMENSSSSTATSVSEKTMRPTDPLYPCNTLSTQYLKLCYEYQSSYFSIITHYDAKATADLCLKVPLEYQDGCIQIIGGGQVGLTSDVKVMSHNCSLMPTSEYRSICNTGVVSSLATRYVGKVDRLTNFCTAIIMEDQEQCFSHIGRVVASWESDPNARGKYCKQIKDKKYSEWCQKSG